MQSNRLLLAALALLPLSSLPGQSAGPGATGLLDRARGTMALVELLQGRPFLRQVSIGECTGEQLGRLLRARCLERHDGDWYRRRGQVLQALSLLPSGVDYLATRLAITRAHTDGLYRSRLGCIYVVPRRCAGMAGLSLLAGQLALAHDDQHYGLARLAEGQISGDRRWAMIGLGRGAARAVEVRSLYRLSRAKVLGKEEIAARERQEQSSIAALFRHPATLVAELYAPQVLGVGFLTGGRLELALKGVGGRVAAAATDPPRSSEQILHPERYWRSDSRDEPVEIELPADLDPGGAPLRLVQTDTLGEIQCALLARPVGFRFPSSGGVVVTDPRFWTNRAATGWGGDRYGLYRDGKGRSALAWVSAWDSKEDALQFFRAYHRQRGASLAAARRQGRVLILVLQAVPDLARPLADRLLETCRFRQRRPWQP